MKDCEFPKLFPKLTLFKVIADSWDKRFIIHDVNTKVMSRLIGTLEPSLGIKSIAPFIVGQLHSIDFWRPESHGHPERYFNGSGMLFAETGQVYSKINLEQFQEDYLIAQLAGLRQ
jgi:hypothetical protein